MIFNYNTIFFENLNARMKHWSPKQNIGDVFLKLVLPLCLSSSLNLSSLLSHLSSLSHLSLSLRFILVYVCRYRLLLN